MVTLPLRRLPGQGMAPLLPNVPVPSHPADAVPTGARRSRIWDINPSLHCSIIGTCLTAADLRRLLAKLNAATKTDSDHTLHKRGVQLAGQRDVAGKLLHKTLDRRHEATVRRFARSSTPEAVRRLWLQALDEGDIPGAYWAVLTHPATDDALMAEAFGEIHMLSHMVGSSNRLDLARLRRAEQALGDRDDTIDRQQVRLQEAAREKTELRRRLDALESAVLRLSAAGAAPAAVPTDAADRATLQRRLDDERARAATLARLLAETQEALAAARAANAGQEHRAAALQAELAAYERAMAREDAVDADADALSAHLAGRTLLYVGGRPGLVKRLKEAAEGRGATLLVHDGGIEDSATLLPGLVSQADAALFPVDCVSHTAAGRVKALCRDADKPFLTLRTASLASFLAAIEQPGFLEVPSGPRAPQ
ncbi:uncharacterized protein DUF2325 [Azospirillum brasilense]|uniref:Uncharacterized protein DUF2325 n=1 Tax=Azospirillum brasilense TaxID=192 RepID=A0A560BC70_AZOBR|nr:DUF2325 domain-containing protein [Azospirillum brasilense]TWA70186.1 uncharacterized protein DUF2325 [Azospirillum brasilense]